ncbi:alpha/beta hydrolase [Enorma sp.]|uniref:alpha/beta hydrolase n=1 Tax=Enorma sp. TaxID=1920692 RepID=UPI003AB37E46
MKTGEKRYERAGGVVDPLPEDAPWFVRDYHDYYKTPRGYHPRSGNSTDGRNITGTMSFLNQPILAYASEIESAVMVLHGDAAHSCYMGKDAFAQLRGDNKELVLVPGAVHTDLYDGGGKDAIPWDTLQEFFEKYLG